MTMNSSDAEQAPARAPGAATMTAVLQRGYGAPERVLSLQTVERPVIAADQVLVRVAAAAVNTPDWIAVTGVPRILRLKTGLRGPASPIRGSDVAGVVEAVGRDVQDFRPGDAVFGSVWDNQPVQPHGTFAEYTAVPAAQLAPKPQTIGFEEAAASVMTGLTALIAMRDVGEVSPGQHVLINGASGGVGSMAVQIAKARGAEVTGVCGTRNVEFVRSLGADHVVDYTQADFTRQGARYDVVLDNVMNHAPADTAGVLAPGGILIPNSVGTSDGMFGALPRMARAMVLGRRGTTRVGAVTCEVNRDNLEALALLLESGTVRVFLDRTYPLGDAAAAVAQLAGHHTRGKLTISVGAPGT